MHGIVTSYVAQHVLSVMPKNRFRMDVLQHNVISCRFVYIVVLCALPKVWSYIQPYRIVPQVRFIYNVPLCAMPRSRFMYNVVLGALAESQLMWNNILLCVVPAGRLMYNMASNLFKGPRSRTRLPPLGSEVTMNPQACSSDGFMFGTEVSLLHLRRVEATISCFR